MMVENGLINCYVRIRGVYCPLSNAMLPGSKEELIEYYTAGGILIKTVNFYIHSINLIAFEFKRRYSIYNKFEYKEFELLRYY